MYPNCPNRTVLDSIANFRNPTVQNDVVEHVYRCQNCRDKIHTKDCLPYSSILTLNLYPFGINEEQIIKLSNCSSCRVMLNDEVMEIYKRRIGD